MRTDQMPYKDAKTNPNFKKKRVDNKDALTIVCNRCNVEKPVSEFFWREENGNYRASCKKCFTLIVATNRKKKSKEKRSNTIRSRINRLIKKGLSNERIQLEETLMEAKELVTVDGKIIRISDINMSAEEQGMFLKYPNGTMIKICGPNAGPEEVNEWFKIRGMKKPV